MSWKEWWSTLADNLSGNAAFYLATVSSVGTDGVYFTLDGQTAPTQKGYKRLQNGQTLQAGARIVVMKQSGTYIVLGEIK